MNYLQGIDQQSLHSQLLELRTRHHHLAGGISGLQQYSSINQLQMQRLKKQKTYLKNQIDCIANLLIPDLDA